MVLFSSSLLMRKMLVFNYELARNLVSESQYFIVKSVNDLLRKDMLQIRKLKIRPDY